MERLPQIMENKDSAQATAFVEKLIDFKLKYNEILEKSCTKDVSLNLCVKKAFEYVVNSQRQLSTLLAKHIDIVMKKQIKGMKDHEINNLFDRILEIFRLLSDKDEFENFYSSNLSKRLLAGVSQNDEAEKLFIQKLKKECGPHYPSKMETMMKDIKVSEELNTDFKITAERRRIPFEMNVHVLTTGKWPNDTVDDKCQIPYEIAPAIDIFTEFYMKKFHCLPVAGSGDTKCKRKLTWKLNFG